MAMTVLRDQMADRLCRLVKKIQSVDKSKIGGLKTTGCEGIAAPRIVGGMANRTHTQLLSSAGLCLQALESWPEAWIKTEKPTRAESLT